MAKIQNNTVYQMKKKIDPMEMSQASKIEHARVFTKPVNPKPRMKSLMQTYHAKMKEEEEARMQTYPAKMKAEEKARMSLPNWKPTSTKKFVPYYGGYGGKPSSGSGWGGEKYKLPGNVKFKK